MHPPLKVCVLGCGRMGLATAARVLRYLPNGWLPLSHAEAAESHPDLDLVALCDPLLEPRQQAGELFPHLPVYEDPTKLLQEHQPDLVCIATRTPERTALIELCVNSGVRRFHLEKPLCTSVAELELLSKLLTSNDIHCTFGTLRRYLSPYRQVHSLLQLGAIGFLKEVQVALGIGRLCWTHIHSIDLISYYLGQTAISEVMVVSRPNSYGSSGSVIDGDPYIDLIRFSTLTGSQGLVSTASGCDLWLHGDQGRIGVLNDGQQIVVSEPLDLESPYFLHHKDIPVVLSPYSGTACALDRHLTNDSDTSRADTRAMLNSQKLLFACAQSILENGRSVKTSDLDSQLVINGRSGSLFA